MKNKAMFTAILQVLAMAVGTYSVKGHENSNDAVRNIDSSAEETF